jgi:transcription initiation factor TFIIIB Brf1 subunit/transcription initiation factor TFIIB
MTSCYRCESSLAVIHDSVNGCYVCTNCGFVTETSSLIHELNPDNDQHTDKITAKILEKQEELSRTQLVTKKMIEIISSIKSSSPHIDEDSIRNLVLHYENSELSSRMLAVALIVKFDIASITDVRKNQDIQSCQIKRAINALEK